MSTKEQLACLQCRSLCCADLLAGNTIYVECSGAGSALQYVEGNVVPLAVAVILAGDNVIIGIGSHAELSALREIDIKHVVAIVANDACLSTLVVVCTEPSLYSITVIFGGGNRTSVDCHNGITVKVERIIGAREIPGCFRRHCKSAATSVVGSGSAVTLIKSPVTHQSLAVACLLLVHLALSLAPWTCVVPQRYIMHLSCQSLTQGDGSHTCIFANRLLVEECHVVCIVCVVGCDGLVVGIIAEAQILPCVLL